MALPAQPHPIEWLRYEWANLHTGTPLAPFTTTVSEDGRPLHETRIDPSHPQGADLVTRFAEIPALQGVAGAQQRPVLDLSDPVRVSAVWLLNGEWLVVSAPRTPVPIPEVTVVPRPQEPARAALRVRKPARPSGRFPFGRLRLTNRKETRT